MNTETAASPSENTICDTAPLLLAMERLASMSFLKPGSWLVSTHPVSAGVGGVVLNAERSTRQFWLRLLSAYFDLTRSRLKLPPIVS